MRLEEHLAVHTPLVWVNTEEGARVTEVICAATDRPVFRMDALDGFLRWMPDKRAWRRALVLSDSGSRAPTFDLGEAVPQVLDDTGILLLDHAHLSIEALVGFLSTIENRFRQAIFSDRRQDIPAQFILLSCTDKIPPELLRHAARVEFDLPDEARLTELVAHITIGAGRPIDTDSTTRIARAGLGMSESEFLDASLLSLQEKGAVTPSFINDVKLENLKTGGILEIRSPSASISDIGGLDLAKELISSVAWTWANPSAAQEYHIEPLRRVLMVGVPGTGKSIICEAVAKTLGLQLGKGGVSSAMSKWVGESESNMRNLFRQIKAMAPLVFWVDELGRDLSGGQSSGSVDGGTTDRVHGEFLTGLQELPDNVFLMAAANRIDGLPPEMLRADRFDKILFVGFPTHAERAEIFGIHLGPRASDFDLDALASATPQFTGAEIKALLREVRFHTATVQHRHPTNADVVSFIGRVKGRVWVNRRGEIIDMYQRAMVEWDWASSGQEAEAADILAQAEGRGPVNEEVVRFGPDGFDHQWSQSQD